MILYEEDEYSHSHITLAKTFIAKNMFQNPKVLSLDHKTISIPTLTKNLHIPTCDSMKIAWRYQNLTLEKEENKFDFQNKILLGQQNHLQVIGPENVMEMIQANDKNTLFVIFSLFSPIWDVKDIERYLYELKRVVKENNHILLVTVPTFMHKNQFCLYFDVVIKFKSLVFDDSVKNYDGLLEIRKNYGVDFPRENNYDANLFGYREGRYGLLIESIDIPPEEGEISGCQVHDMF